MQCERKPEKLRPVQLGRCGRAVKTCAPHAIAMHGISASSYQIGQGGLRDYDRAILGYDVHLSARAATLDTI